MLWNRWWTLVYELRSGCARTRTFLWMATCLVGMTPLRRITGNQYLHHKSEAYRNAVRRKIAAYHRHIQLGLIAQGLLQILSATVSTSVWQCFGSWIRTIRPGLEHIPLLRSGSGRTIASLCRRNRAG